MTPTADTFSDIFVWFDELRVQGVLITEGATGSKLVEEAKEFCDEPSLEEAADIVIALCGAVETLGFDETDLQDAIRNKMVVNRARTWERQPDGTYRHVKETTQ